MREQFSLGPIDSIRAAHAAVRAQMAFAPKENDPDTALRWLTRFYSLSPRRDGVAAIDLAHAELDYWIVHRQIVDNADKTPLIDAFAHLHSLLFGGDQATMRPSAEQRTLACNAVDRITGVICRPRRGLALGAIPPDRRVQARGRCVAGGEITSSSAPEPVRLPRGTTAGHREGGRGWLMERQLARQWDDLADGRSWPARPVPGRSATRSVSRDRRRRAIRIAWRSVSDWPAPQFASPGVENYASVATDALVRLTPVYGSDGVRPWNRTLTIRISDGALAPGDVVTIVLGDTSAGSIGMRAQTFPERQFRFLLQADPFGTGVYEHVTDLGFPIVGGEATWLVAVAPSDVVAGEPFRLQVRALDQWGNPDPGYRGTLRFDGPDGVPSEYTMTEADAGVHWFEGVSFSRAGVQTIQVRDDVGRATESNPIRCHEQLPTQRLYWGDLHGQTEETVGTGSVADYLAYARDVAAVDATGHQGNDFQITGAIYEHIQSGLAAANEPGRFVTFHGYEWSGNTPAGGDRNIYYRDGGPIHRSSHTLIADRSDADTDRYPADRLHATFAGRDDVLSVPHIGGRHASLHFHDAQIEPVIEIASQWGRFEWFARDALDGG